jgi:lytic murein transglycosylase
MGGAGRARAGAAGIFAENPRGPGAGSSAKTPGGRRAAGAGLRIFAEDPPPREQGFSAKTLAVALALALWAGAGGAQGTLGIDAAVEGEGIVAASQEGFEAWLSAFRTRALAAGLPAPLVDAALRGLIYDAKIVERDRAQAEFTKTIWTYLDTAVSDDRVTFGRRALDRHGALLDRIGAAYGVDPAIVAAIWGLESAYGAYRGDTPVLGALATLAYDGRRGAFFERELVAALAILATGEASLADLRGSWAGAMGHTQFMPSSWAASAVDFTGDGRRDIWGDDPADALASTAAYLAQRGWVAGAPWGLEVRLPAGFDLTLADERQRRPVAEWAALGVTPAAGGALPDHGPASVILPAGVQGAAFLIFENFRVLETYNSADAYVIAVGHLADRLRGGPPIAAAWPRHWRALTGEERREVQARLTALGHDTQGVDGRIGPRTTAAVRAFQLARGLPADGYASPDLLEALRAAGG